MTQKPSSHIEQQIAKEHHEQVLRELSAEREIEKQNRENERLNDFILAGDKEEWEKEHGEEARKLIQQNILKQQRLERRK